MTKATFSQCSDFIIGRTHFIFPKAWLPYRQSLYPAGKLHFIEGTVIDFFSSMILRASFVFSVTHL